MVAERLYKLALLENWRDLDENSAPGPRSTGDAASCWRTINPRPRGPSRGRPIRRPIGQVFVGMREVGDED
jgi:hypothetical protein